MFKKIWNYFFAGNSEIEVDVNEMQSTLNTVQDSIENLVVIDYTLTKAQEPSKVDVLPEEKPIEPNAFITDYSVGRMNSPYGPYAWLMQAPTEPEAAALYKFSQDSERIYFYNIGHMDHEKSHPIFRSVRFPSCEAGQPYKYTFSIPSILAQTNFSVDNPKETHTFLVDGKRVATDLVNPDSFGTDQYADYGRSVPSSGNNLTQKGVFWSFNNPPSEEDLEKAKKVHRKYCKALLEKACTASFIKKPWIEERIHELIKKWKYTEAEAMKKAYSEIEITPEHHAAAEFMKVKTDWHPVLENKRKR